MLDIEEDRMYAHSFSMSTLGKLRLKQMLSKLLDMHTRAERQWHERCHYGCIHDNDLANCHDNCD